MNLNKQLNETRFNMINISVVYIGRIVKKCHTKKDRK